MMARVEAVLEETEASQQAIEAPAEETVEVQEEGPELEAMDPNEAERMHLLAKLEKTRARRKRREEDKDLVRALQAL